MICHYSPLNSSFIQAVRRRALPLRLALSEQLWIDGPITAEMLPDCGFAASTALVHSSIVGDHEVCKVPGVLISLHFDLFFLFVHRQFDCRQDCPGALTVGRE